MLLLLRTSISLEAFRFANQIALSWLAYYPGDLLVSSLYSQALSRSGSFERALSILNDLIKVDPEKTENLEILFLTSQLSGVKIQENLIGCAYALNIETGKQISLPAWAHPLREARIAYTQQNYAVAEEYIHQALLTVPQTALVGITHLQIGIKRPLPQPALQDLAAYYHKRWPTCLTISLIFAETLLDRAWSEQAVGLIHQVSVQDVAAEVVTRLWGPNHPYRRIWSDHLEAPLDTPIPADVLAAIGWNQLPQGKEVQTSSETFEPLKHSNDPPTESINEPEIDSKPEATQSLPTEESTQPVHHISPPFEIIPESLRSVQEELERVAERLKQNHLAHADGRFPIYIIFTTHQGLEKHYGSDLSSLDQSMIGLTSAIRKRSDWGAELIYADDQKSMGAFGLQPAKFDDPWDLKLALVDLDIALARRGEMIGAVLIIGGPEVVPFHHLPNPVDDIDDYIPSDNPYATRDENYFVPEWIVGRLPAGARGDVNSLRKVLANITECHNEFAYSQPWFLRWWNRLTTRLNFHRWQPGYNKSISWGSTAAIWRRASFSVFRPIGPPHAMQVSPPAQVDLATSQDEILPASRLGYFNLHGLQDSSEWFGHRDPSEPGDGDDYPVALRPQDVVNSGRAPKIVFTEACYGTHIYDKKFEESIALKFLTSGTQVVVGSTSTSYGSIAPPLIAADLFGHTFWKYLRKGLTAGESFRRAKIHMAREMLRRQGFLDGEDQKTLISFVLFGDPLAQLADFEYHRKSIYRPLKRPARIRTICDRVTGECREVVAEQAIPPGVMAQVKHVVEQYLPGMEDAQVHFSNKSSACQDSCPNCPSSLIGKKQKNIHISGRKVVTLSKSVPSNLEKNSTNELPCTLIHRHYARLTLDEYGKLVKLAVSR